MPLPWLRERDADARELMDDPDADPVVLARTYARFAPVNAVVSGRGAVYRQWIRPLLVARAPDAEPLRVLDVGTGGGDLPRALLRLAARDGFAISVLAIDPDPRAIAAAASRPPVAGLELRQTGTRALAVAGERFDVVLSNHVLHHLAPRELGAILADSERLTASGGVVVHGDIARSPLAYAAFALGTLPFEPTLLRRTFIRPDGLASIRRSHTPTELAAAAPPGWTVRGAIPWRLELVWRAP